MPLYNFFYRVQWGHNKPEYKTAMIEADNKVVAERSVHLLHPGETVTVVTCVEEDAREP